MSVLSSALLVLMLIVGLLVTISGVVVLFLVWSSDTGDDGEWM